QAAFATHLASHAGHFSGEAVQLVHHRVQGFLELENFTANVHRDFAGKVATGDGARYFGDVSHLRGEVAGHEVDVIRQVFPGTGDPGHHRLASQLAVGTYLASDARNF